MVDIKKGSDQKLKQTYLYFGSCSGRDQRRSISGLSVDIIVVLLHTRIKPWLSIDVKVGN